jgi:hypothetical protein
MHRNSQVNVERELIPMAKALNSGVTAWSNAGWQRADRQVPRLGVIEQKVEWHYFVEKQ